MYMRNNLLISVVGRDEHYKAWFNGKVNYDIVLIIYNDLKIPEEFSSKCNIIYKSGYKWDLIKWYIENNNI